MRRSLAAALVLLAACSASRSSFEAGNRSASDRDWDEAVVHYRAAAREEPENLEYKIALQRALVEASRAHLRRARDYEGASDLEGAEAALELAVRYDPTNRYAGEELLEIRRRLEEAGRPPPHVFRERLLLSEPVVDPASDAPLDLAFAEDTSLRSILEALGRLSGVNVLFDESFRDRRVSVDLKGVTFEQALELLLATNGLFYKVVDSSTVRIVREAPP